jgi:hypothetical protein
VERIGTLELLGEGDPVAEEASGSLEGSLTAKWGMRAFSEIWKVALGGGRGS